MVWRGVIVRWVELSMKGVGCEGESEDGWWCGVSVMVYELVWGECDGV